MALDVTLRDGSVNVSQHELLILGEEENVELQEMLNKEQPFEFHNILQSAASSSVNMGIYCEKIEKKLSKEQNPEKDHKNQIYWIKKVSLFNHVTMPIDDIKITCPLEVIILLVLTF